MISSRSTASHYMTCSWSDAPRMSQRKVVDSDLIIGETVNFFLLDICDIIFTSDLQRLCDHMHTSATMHKRLFDSTPMVIVNRPTGYSGILITSPYTCRGDRLSSSFELVRNFDIFVKYLNESG